MTRLKAYYRPSSVEEALQLLARPQVTSLIVAGGTYINAHLAENVDEVIDLQATGLDTADEVEGRLRLGAMVRLQTLVELDQTPALVRQMARREGPNTLRNQATIGGIVVGADPESELLAALLVHEAEVEVQSRSGSKQIALSDFLADVPAALDGGLVTAVSVVTSGRGTGERVARTPADRPIVAAVARRDDQGRIHLALCGVASTPLLVNPDPDQLNLTPPADFRGSSAYRRQMAITLSRRVISALHEDGN
jgi:carbon-monoxide dehydrogenase medium subunit/putative selenate reductase FAD-binding subunit